MPIVESPYHSWNRIGGSPSDYVKELLNHKRASLLLEAVQIRMKELYERRCNNVKEKLLGREQRQIELEKIMSYPEISQEAFTGVSKHLKVSVQEQGNYLDEITGSNKED